MLLPKRNTELKTNSKERKILKNINTDKQNGDFTSMSTTILSSAESITSFLDSLTEHSKRTIISSLSKMMTDWNVDELMKDIPDKKEDPISILVELGKLIYRLNKAEERSGLDKLIIQIDFEAYMKKPQAIIDRFGSLFGDDPLHSEYDIMTGRRHQFDIESKYLSDDFIIDSLLFDICSDMSTTLVSDTAAQIEARNTIFNKEAEDIEIPVSILFKTSIVIKNFHEEPVYYHNIHDNIEN